MVKTILFDFGGVIYQHPKEVIPEVISKIYGQPLEDTIREYAKYKNDYFAGKITTETVINSLSSSFKSNKSIDEVKTLWLKYYGELAQANNRVVDLIKKLREHNKVYLFTNTTEMSDLYNRKTGIYELFDGLFKSFEMKLVKPDLVCYEKVISVLGVESEEIIFIDDDEKNLKPAQELGMKTIYFNVLENTPEELEKSFRSLQVIGS